MNRTRTPTLSLPCACHGTDPATGEHRRPRVATCGICQRSWCDTCEPCPAALCPFCHGASEPQRDPVEEITLTRIQHEELANKRDVAEDDGTHPRADALAAVLSSTRWNRARTQARVVIVGIMQAAEVACELKNAASIMADWPHESGRNWRAAADAMDLKADAISDLFDLPRADGIEARYWNH